MHENKKCRPAWGNLFFVSGKSINIYIYIYMVVGNSVL